MALSTKAKKRLEVAMARRTEANEVIAAIDNGTNAQAASVAAMGSTTNIPAVAGTYVDTAEPTGAEVNATVQTSVTAIEARLDAIEAKVDELIAALKTATIMLT